MSAVNIAQELATLYWSASVHTIGGQ